MPSAAAVALVACRLLTATGSPACRKGELPEFDRNWLRSLPWVWAWADKYPAKGLVVVGVQTPEFKGVLENVVQMLLREPGANIDRGLVSIEPEGVEAAAD